MTNGFSSQFFDLGNGQQLHYLSNANHGKPKLLVLHGVNTQASYFDEFFPFITADYDIYAPDFRGHGESFHSSEPYTLSNYAKDISPLIEQVIGEPFFLLGMSLGGRIGLILATQHRNWLKKLAVVDVGPDVDPAGLDRIIQGQAQLPASFASREEVETFYASAYKNVSPHYIERIIRHGWKRLANGAMVTSYDRQIWNLGRDSFTEDARSLNALVPQIEQPVLIIRGGLSDILQAAAAQRFVQQLQQGELVEIPNTTHGVILEEPAQCAQRIGSFFARP